MNIQSDLINELAKAISVAQGEMTFAPMDSVNPHFKSEFASLESYIKASKAQLAKNGLAVIQTTATVDGKLNLITTLTHSSGQWIRSFTPILSEKQTAQGMGSGISYARRYALAAIVGLSQYDDDGNSASQGSNHPSAQPTKEPVSSGHSFKVPEKFKPRPDQILDVSNPGDYVLKLGYKEIKGKALKSIGAGDISNHMNWIKNKCSISVRDSQSAQTDLAACEAFLRSSGTTEAEADLFGNRGPQDDPPDYSTEPWPESAYDAAKKHR